MISHTSIQIYSTFWLHKARTSANEQHSQTSSFCLLLHCCCRFIFNCPQIINRLIQIFGWNEIGDTLQREAQKDRIPSIGFACVFPPDEDWLYHSQVCSRQKGMEEFEVVQYLGDLGANLRKAELEEHAAALQSKDEEWISALQRQLMKVL